jgi:hypothetical protein
VFEDFGIYRSSELGAIELIDEGDPEIYNVEPGVGIRQSG